MNPSKVHQFGGAKEDPNKRQQYILNIEDFDQSQQSQFQQNQKSFPNSIKSDYYQTRHTNTVSPNIRRDIGNLDNLLKELNSKNVGDLTQDQYSTHNSILTENYLSKINTNTPNYGKSLLDQLINKQHAQQLINKLSHIFYYNAFQSLKQVLIFDKNQQQNNSTLKTTQNQSFNGFRTPTRVNIQKHGLNTSDRSYQISTGYTENQPYDEQIKKIQVQTNYFKDLQNLDRDELLRELQQRLTHQEFMIQQLNNTIKALNDKIKADNAQFIELEVQKSIESEEIKSLQEELRLHQRDNDMLNDQLTELRNQNIIQSEKQNEFERLVKLESRNNQDLLQRIKDQQKLIDEKTSKNIELQDQVLSLIQSKTNQQEETKQKSILEFHQIQIQELKKQLEYLQRQNDNLRQDNMVLFEEKEVSLQIISQLDAKFDEERNQSKVNIEEMQKLVNQKEIEIKERERQFENQREEMLSIFEQTKQSLIRKDQEEKRASISKQQNNSDLSQKLQIMKIKSINVAAKNLNKILQFKELKNAYKKISQTSNERFNHRSISRLQNFLGINKLLNFIKIFNKIRNQSKSPANRSGNKRDLSPLRDKTFIERRRIVSFGKYLFLKYKKIMQRVFFVKLKALNKVEKNKENNNLEKKSIQLIKILDKKKLLSAMKVWKTKINVLNLFKLIQKIQYKKFAGFSFDKILQRSEQQKNNQKMIQFCTALCNFVIKLSKRQLNIGFSQLSANRLLTNLRANKLQIVLIKYLIKQKKDTLITYFRKWRTFNEIQAIQEQAYMESQSIQEKKRDLDQEISSFFGNRIDLEKIEHELKQRVTERSAEKKSSIRGGSNRNFESTRTFAIPQKSQMENIYEEVSFRQNNQQKQVYSEICDQVQIKMKHNRKESLGQKNLFLNEFDLNQDNMLFSNDIYKKNLSNRSCQSHKSSSQSYKSSYSNQSQARSRNGGDKSPTASHSDQLIQSISNKYLYPNQNRSSIQISQESYRQNNSDMSIISETLQEQRNFYKQ